MARDIVVYSTYSYISGARPIPDDADALEKVRERVKFDPEEGYGRHVLLERIDDKLRALRAKRV